MSQLKVEELKDVLSLVIEMADCAQLVAAEGGLSLTDVSNMWSVIEKLGPAFRGIEHVPDELADLDAADCDELIQFVMSELSAQSDKSKMIVEKSLKAFKAAYEVYLEIKA